jgi:hypothetical protein
VPIGVPFGSAVAVLVGQHSQDAGDDPERQQYDERNEGAIENGHAITSWRMDWAR